MILLASAFKSVTRH